MKNILLLIVSLSIFSMGESKITGFNFNGQKVSLEEVKIMSKDFLKKDYEKEDDAGKRDALDKIINMNVVIQEAKLLDMHKTDKHNKLLRLFSDLFLMEGYSSMMYDNFSVTETMIEDYYNNNPTLFIRLEQYKISHIMSPTKDESINVLEKFKNVKDIGVEFGILAKRYSIDPAFKEGGILGWITKEQSIKEFWDACKDLKVGDIYKTPIKTQYGYHIILLNDKMEEESLSLVEFKKDLNDDVKKAEKLKEEMFLPYLQEKIKKIRENKYNVKILY